MTVLREQARDDKTTKRRRTLCIFAVLQKFSRSDEVLRLSHVPLVPTFHFFGLGKTSCIVGRENPDYTMASGAFGRTAGQHFEDLSCLVHLCVSTLFHLLTSIFFCSSCLAFCGLCISQYSPSEFLQVDSLSYVTACIIFSPLSLSCCLIPCSGSIGRIGTAFAGNH
ncbi:hypothetical protein VTK73DRAFT_1437 [Phialemonium thermophilum]|uniref:Uncharacterized protein n=1 Tax=Phialemonium thermophilum TaxID=223376 RepID=A0ABR3X9K6_9PEZI